MLTRSARHPARSTVYLAALLAQGAIRAQQPAPGEASTSVAQTLSPVTVTANREREVVAKDAAVGVLGDMRLIDTPFSLNVITRELLDKQQAAFLGDFLKNDPSAVVGNVAVPFATLRGFAIGSDGQLYDGLPGHGGLSDGRAGLQGIERIDVLKGAGAFLYEPPRVLRRLHRLRMEP